MTDRKGAHISVGRARLGSHAAALGLVLGLSAGAQETPFGAGYLPPSSIRAFNEAALNCPQHFSGSRDPSCETADLLSRGEALCHERYGSSYSAQLDQLQRSLSPPGEASQTQGLDICQRNDPSPASGVLNSTGLEVFDIVSEDPSLASRIDLLERGYETRLLQPGLTPSCRARLQALKAEMAKARICYRPLRIASQRARSLVPTVPLQRAQQAQQASPPLALEIASAPHQKPAEPVTRDSAQAPPPPSSSSEPSLDQAVQTSPLPPSAAPRARSPFETMVPAAEAPPVFSEARSASGNSSWPPRCALDAMVDEARRENQDYHEKGFFGRIFATITGNAPSSKSEEILRSPTGAEDAFDKLSQRKREKYLAFCPEGIPKSLEEARMAQRSQTAGGGAPVLTPQESSDASSWPPQCVLNVMQIETALIKQENESHSWLGRLFNPGLPSLPKNADQILKDPRAAFAEFSPDEKAKYLTVCQHKIPPSQWDLARYSTGGKFEVPEYVKEEAWKPVSAIPASQGGAGWPPQCAIDAYVDEIHALKDRDQGEGWAVRNLMAIAGEEKAPENSDQIMKDPHESFLKLDPDDQTKYINVCLLEGPDALGAPASGLTAVEGQMSGIPMTADGRPEMPTPPSCAIDAFQKDINDQLAKDRDRGWFSRTLAHWFGDGPPEGAEEMAAHPKEEFQKLAPPLQIQYLRACLPCPENPEKPGLVTRIRRWFQNMGWFGKTLTVLGTALFGAILWRIRGGFLPTGNTQVARLIASVPMAMIGGLLAGPAGILAGGLTFFELAFSPPGLNWSKNFGMINANKSVNWGLVANMTGRGIWQTLLTGMALMSPFMMLTGAAMGPIYLLADRFMQTWNVGGSIGLAGYYTQWAELFTGAWIYGSFAATLLAQNAHHAKVVSCIAGVH